jgi:hypothetical protein
MRKLPVIVSTLAICVAVGVVTMASAAKTPKVTSRVSLDFSGKFSGGAPTGNPYTPYTPITFRGEFSGKVKGKKGCKKRRKVTISRGIGSTKSNRNGAFMIRLDAVPPSGKYTAKVKRKKITKGGKKITCRKAKDTIDIG